MSDEAGATYFRPVLQPPASRRKRLRIVAATLWSLARVEATTRRTPLHDLCIRQGVRFGGFAMPADSPGVLTRDVIDRWWAVESCLRWWPWARHRPCLRRSLVLGHHLKYLSPVLCFEVTSMAPFQAHAWLMVCGYRLDMGDAGPLVTLKGATA